MKITAKQEKHLKLQKENKIRSRFFNRNIEAMQFCNSHGLTIYPAAQGNSMTSIKLFVQKGEGFRPLDNILYDQNEEWDRKRYVAAIDAEYERLYLKMKDKVK